MAADVGMEPVGFHYHGQGVPAHVAFDAPLDFAVARISRLSFNGNRIDVRRGDGEGNLEAGFTQSLDQFLHEQRCLPGFLVPENILENVFQRSEPFVLTIALGFGVISMAANSAIVFHVFFFCFHL